MTALLINDYDGQLISFTDEAWFNATQAAAKFGKRPIDWLRLPETDNYLEALCRKSDVRKSHFTSTKKGNSKDFQQGTWLHPKLAVRFAQWLDVDFAVWCDEQIDNILRGKLDKNRLRHEAASGSKVMAGILQLARAENGKSTKDVHYSNEARLVNWALSGKFEGLDRDSMSAIELDVLAKLQEKNSVLIARNVEYATRKIIIEQYAIDLRCKQQIMLAA